LEPLVALKTKIGANFYPEATILVPWGLKATAFITVYMLFEPTPIPFPHLGTPK
jgi:hypothetical protein